MYFCIPDCAYEEIKLCHHIFGASDEATFVNNPQNAGQPWIPGEAADPVEKNVQIPRMIYLPSVIAKYMCKGEPKTAHQMYVHVGEKVNEDGSGLTEVDAALLQMWCMAAGQIEPGKTVALSVAVKPDPVVQVSPSFQKWAKQKLVGYLGEGPSSPIQAQAPNPAAAQMFAGAQFESIIICKTFVIPNQYPTLILVRSDLTFTVSDPKKMVGHKIRMHHSKFRPNKNQCRRRKIPQHPILDRANSYVH
jgi:hypothetical protein